MRMLRIMTAVMTSSLASSCVSALELIAKCPSGITVSANVNTRVKKYPLLARIGDPVERARIAGKLHIRNDTASVIQYSNREVLLAVGNDAGVQAYRESFASDVIDFGYIDLAPNQSRQLKVYWPSKLPAGTDAGAVAMSCISLRPADAPPPDKSLEHTLDSAFGSDLNYVGVLESVARDIAALKQDHPQLAEFSIAKNTDVDNLRISYGYHTHKPESRGGWSAGVPNPDEDGIWFYIDFHDASSTAEIHTQPAMRFPECIGDKRVSFLILEGTQTKTIAGAVSRILEEHGMNKCNP